MSVCRAKAFARNRGYQSRIHDALKIVDHAASRPKGLMMAVRKVLPASLSILWKTRAVHMRQQRTSTSSRVEASLP